MLRMVRLYIRVIAAIVAVAAVGLAVTGAYYVYRESYVPEVQRAKEVKALLDGTAPKADPGLKRYDRAMDLIRERNFEGAAAALREILEIYQDSARFADARRVLGEMNLDRLFSRTPMPGKLEYTVARGDSLQLIAKKHRTTVAFIKRVNNLLGGGLHPGDRLVVYPLDFTMEVDLDEKRVTLLRDGEFFRDYNIEGMNLPFPNLPRETTISDKPAWLNGKKIQPMDERYTAAQKWLQTAGRSGRPGVVFRVDPARLPPPVPHLLSPPSVSGQEEGGKKKGKAAKGKKSGAPEDATAAEPVTTDAPATPGIYLSEKDMEELSTLVRTGTPLKFLKSSSPAAKR